MTYNKIPTEEEFARAKAAIRENDRGLSDLREIIKKRFEKDSLYEIFTFYSPKTDAFYPHVFLRWHHQIAEAEQSGLTDRIKDAVYEELERVGRGSRDSIKVNFEFDSHENVERNYEGDYFLRLK